MKNVIPSLYFGSIDYYRTLMSSDEVMIEMHEHYVKQTQRSRCYIYGANGILSLIVPVRHEKKEKIPMKDIKICNDFRWQKIHWKSIESAYRSSSYFEFFEDEFHPVFAREFEFMVDLNETIREILFRLLEIKTPVLHTREYFELSGVTPDRKIPGSFQKEDMSGETPDIHNDLRDKFNVYTTGTNHRPYNQVFESRHGFIPNLSIIDLLFNCGKEAAVYFNA